MSVASRVVVVLILVLQQLLMLQVSSKVLEVDRVSKPYSAADMYWVDNEGQFLESLSGNFVLGFNNQNSRDKYFLSVSFALQATNAVVWVANRDVGVGRENLLIFQEDGNLVLFGPRGLPVWQTWTNGTDAQYLQMRNDGNLVILDSKNSTIWQSFDHPSDTLLEGQRLTPGTLLVSSVSSSSDWSPGMFSLRLRDNTMELLADLGGGTLLPYWNMSSDTHTILQQSNSAAAFAAVDGSGNLQIFGKDSTAISSYKFGPPSKVNTSAGFLVLGSDGNLKFKSGSGLPDYPVLADDCNLPMRCGSYGVCSSNGQCNCPGTLPQVNSLDASQGCKVRPLDLCRSPRRVKTQDLNPGLSYFGVDYGNPIPASSLDACKDLCMKNCSCTTGFFVAASQSCYLSLTQKLGSFKLDSSSSLQTFIKVPEQGSRTKQKISIFAIVGASAALIVCSIAVFAWWYRRRLITSRGDPDEEDGFLDSIPGLPTRFTFKDLQVATNGFSKKLGGGGFGSVYEGILPDKSKVAVKQLESIGQGKKEFRAEVATIGGIHHNNLVRLRGFCSEGTHRLLVYEFLARGSLDKSLFAESNPKLGSPEPVLLDWDTRYNIALGTARGLAYLHEDCRERIIHCDIKPENILLDESFTAKVSDFGLAKLMNREQSHVFTTMRGTRGYLAPEWLLHTAISEKSDVYSFGMVLLEIVSGRKNFDPNEISEKWYIPAYAFKQAEIGELAELLDPRLKGFAKEEQVVKAVKIALWCIQEEMHMRPSTGKVVQMLEGNVPVQDPPLSSQLAIRLHGRLADAVSERDRYSIGSEFNSEDLLSASYLSGPR